MSAPHPTLNYLLQTVRLCEQHAQKPLHKCPPLDWFVARNGHPFPDVRHRWDGDIRIERGPLGNCFENAVKAVWGNPGRLVYIEGYAANIIPVYHAWVYDRRTQCCYDPTWDDGRDYFGVPFSLQYLNRTLLDKQSYGIIDWWQKRWPILRQAPARWQAPTLEPA